LRDKVQRPKHALACRWSRIQAHTEVVVKKWIRRIRGAIGMGLTWAAAWFGAGLALLLVVGFGAADVPFPLFFGLLGFLAGVTFSGVLGLVEGRRRFDQMSLPRFAAWGGAGGSLLAGIFVVVAQLGGEAFLLLGPVFGLSGAVCAAGSLALARIADDRDLLDAGEGVGEVGLTAEERRELLGGDR
jgi:hypothetical protein